MTDANSTKFDRASGLALILGSLAGLVTMALHPTGHDVLNSPRAEIFISIAVHALALLASPVLFLGALGLSRRLSLSSLRVLTALIFYAFSLIAVISAAIMSGLVNSAVAHQLAEPAAAVPDTWSVLFHYTGMLNQGYALAFVVGSSLAILLWSHFLYRTRTFSRALGIYGCVIAPLALIAVLSGNLPLNVHGFGAIILTQSIWFILAGQRLRAPAPSN